MREVREEKYELKTYSGVGYPPKVQEYHVYAVSKPIEEYKSPYYGTYTSAYTPAYTSTTTYARTPEQPLPSYGSRRTEEGHYALATAYGSTTYAAKESSSYQDYYSTGPKQEGPTVPSYGREGAEGQRRGFLAGLELKESIDMEEPMRRQEEVRTLLDGQLKQSLKESISLGTSNEFTFDF
jgi:hypothetical protein